MPETALPERVDFYVLPEQVSAMRFVCGLINKILQQDLRIFVYLASEDEAVALDDLLWTYKDISFLPHALANDPASSAAPVVLGWSEPETDALQVVVNLTANVPGFATACNRIVELAGPGSEARAMARIRYRKYAGFGCQVYSHEIDAKHATY